MDQEKIGNLIKSIRLENNLTQKEFADKLGVTYQAVSKWENGRNLPDINILKLISDEFNVNIDEILSGKKNDNKNRRKIVIPIIIFLIIVIFVIILINIKYSNNDFEFKTISSKCSSFKITGSAAYNKDKTAIYISNVEFCGRDEDVDNTEYKKMNCTLYEVYNDTKNLISKCPSKNNINLEEYLKDIKINVDNYSYTCSEFKSADLLLEINAFLEDDKEITYKVPIELKDNC